MDIKNYISRSAAGIIATGAYNTVRDLVSRSAQAHSSVLKDPPFANIMQYKKSQYPKRRTGRRMKRSYVKFTDRNLGNDIIPMRRTADSALIGAVGAGLSYSVDINLNNVYTADLLQSYSHYRIRKVVAEIMPNLDAGNVGPGGNYCLHAFAACDPNGGFSASVADIQRLDNHRYKGLPSGSKMIYTFYPKAINTMVGAGGANVQVGSYTMNPWIQLNANGILVPHKTFLLHITSLSGVSPADMHVTYTIFFDVKSIR